MFAGMGERFWDQALSSIEIEGVSEDQKKIFFMYHAMIDPRVISDVDGRYTGADDKIHIGLGNGQVLIPGGNNTDTADLTRNTLEQGIPRAASTAVDRKIAG
jgi:Glycosyl hydrolase family 92